MIKLMLLLAGITTPIFEVDQEESKHDDMIEIIQNDLMLEMADFQFIQDTAKQVFYSAEMIEDPEAMKCIEYSLGAINMLNKPVDFEYGSAMKAIQVQQIDLAEFHLVQLINVVDKAENILTKAEQCLWAE